MTRADTLWRAMFTVVTAAGVGMSTFVIGIPVAIAWFLASTACALVVCRMLWGAGDSSSARLTPARLVRTSLAVGLGMVAVTTASALVPAAGIFLTVVLVATCPSTHRAARRRLAARATRAPQGKHGGGDASTTRLSHPPTPRPSNADDLQATWRASYWALRTTHRDELLGLVEERARCLDQMAHRVGTRESVEWWGAVSAHTLPPVSPTSNG